MDRPFPGEDGNTGIEVIPIIWTCSPWSAGPPAPHCRDRRIGDRANQLVLDAYQDLIRNPLDASPGMAGRDVEPAATRLRHRIEHTSICAQRTCSAWHASASFPPCSPPTAPPSDIPAGLHPARLAANWPPMRGARPIDAGAVPPSARRARGAARPAARHRRRRGDPADPRPEPDGGWQPGRARRVARRSPASPPARRMPPAKRRPRAGRGAGARPDFTALGADPYAVGHPELRAFRSWPPPSGGPSGTGEGLVTGPPATHVQHTISSNLRTKETASTPLESAPSAPAILASASSLALLATTACGCVQ